MGEAGSSRINSTSKSSTDDLFEGHDIWSFEVESFKVKFHFIAMFLFQPVLKPGRNHSLLYEYPLPTDDRPPRPYRKHPIPWDKDHVRLPFALESQFTEIDENGSKSLKNRWNLIEESLLQPIVTSRDLEKAIKKYNNRYEDIWSFDTLHHLFDNFLPPEEVSSFFHVLLPAIINSALQLPQLIQSPVPLLKRNMNHSLSLSQQQISSLLANAFLCTFPLRNTDKRNSEYASYPTINFCKLFSATGNSAIEKLKCILNYFTRVLLQEVPINVVTFQRRTIDTKFKWESSHVELSKTKFQVMPYGNIERAKGMLQIDFANRLVGGGVIGNGCVQEEIRFVINPEMIVARLFTQSLDNDEALIMIGCEQFNQYRGYASSFEWSGDFKDETPLDTYRRRKCRVVAIDALFYRSMDMQFNPNSISRELNKAFVGFYKENESDKSPVASGLWGCGAFNGHPVRSALIQLMACSVAERNIAFYTFGDYEANEQIADIFDFVVKQKATVGAIFTLLTKFHPADPSVLGLYIKNEFTRMNQMRTPVIKLNSQASSKVKQSSLFNFFIPPSSKSERPPSPDFMPSTSFANWESTDFVTRDKQKFDEVAKVFGSPRQKENDGKKSKLSLIDALDCDMETSGRKS